MSIDIEHLLKRVLDEVFRDVASIEYTADSKHAHDWRASVVAMDDLSREVTIWTTYEWFSAGIPVHNVGTIVFDCEDDESEKEATLRELALVMLAYVQGGGSVESRRGMFGLRQRPFITIDQHGKRWTFGRHTSSVEVVGSDD